MSAPALTDEQLREAWEAYVAHEHKAYLAADYLGLNRKTFTSRLRVARAKGLHLSAGAARIVAAAKLNPVEAKGGWVHSYDNEGKKIGATRWAPPDGDGGESIAEQVRRIMEGLPPVPVIEAPARCDADLLTVYPIADRHQGMRAHRNETGEEYNSEIAKARLVDWMGRCIASAPASKRAVILDIGDGQHINDGRNQTPRSGHPLDVDARPFDVVDASIESLDATVQMAARKHEEVEVRILPGNHDPEIYLAVMFGLWGIYRDNPRIRVRKEPGEFWVRQFGKVMLAANHGHKAKPKQLVDFCADEFAPIWGQTKYRVLFTGHLHHAKITDIGGMTHEQLSAMCARDAHAASSAYVSRAKLQAITYDKTHGEVHRCTVAA